MTEYAGMPESLITSAQYVLSPLRINAKILKTDAVLGPFFMLTQWVVYSLIFLNGFLVALNEDYSKQMDILIKTYGRKTIDLLSSMKMLIFNSLGLGFIMTENDTDAAVVKSEDQSVTEEDDQFLLRIHVTYLEKPQNRDSEPENGADDQTIEVD